MNQECNRTATLPGEADYVRGVHGRRRRTPATAPNDPGNRGSASPAQRPLRRWSVAELIARASVPPAGYRTLT